MSDEHEDRFSDLRGKDEHDAQAGPGGDDEAAADRRRRLGEQLAERDRTHPERVERPQGAPRPGNKYTWLVGILMLMGLVVLLFTTTLRNTGEGVLGLERGQRLPDFAAPLARSALEGDANVCQRRPCPEGSGPQPACEVRARGVLNVCELRQRPLVLTFVFDRAADCFPQVDRTERVMEAFPRVRFATVYFSRKDRAEVREIVRRRRWTQPVGIDRDGQVANRYGVGVCPTTVFSKAGGRVAETELGNLTEAQLRRRTRRLLSAR